MKTTEEATRISELERKLAEKERELEGLRRELLRFRTMVEHAPVGMFEDDASGACTYVNPRWCEIAGMEAADALGLGWLKLMHPEDAAAMTQKIAGASSAAPVTVSGDYRMIRPDGEIRWVHGQTNAIVDDDGKVVGYVGSATDVTERRHAKEALQRVQEELERRVEERTKQLLEAGEDRATLEAQVIISQESLIRELSTPLMPIADGVLAMPLVGSISAARAEQILETLLAGVSEAGARVAILDITGVPTVDTHAADGLIRAARATRLLGAEVVVTGIGPAVAQTLVELGVGLGEMITRSTLQAGIAYALGRARGR
jgi:PAS domain S-box-containing protein